MAGWKMLVDDGAGVVPGGGTDMVLAGAACNRRVRGGEEQD